MSHHPDLSHCGEDAARTRATATRSVRDGATAQGSLDQYLRDIGAYPLISRDDEVRLAQRIREHDQEALDELVRSNLRFVVAVAKRYQRRGVLLADLINDGNLGLIRAARKFDETRGIKFISYAVYWIRQAILQALADQSRIVRVPASRAGTLNRVNRRANRLLQDLEREPTHKEVAEGLGIAEEEVAQAMAMARASVSLDAPMAPGASNVLLDYVADDKGATSDDRISEDALTDAVRESLGTLRPREAVILRLYFGLDGDEVVTLEQIGTRLGITRERVRQIKDRTLLRLRHTTDAKSLAMFACPDGSRGSLAPCASPDLRSPTGALRVPTPRSDVSLVLARARAAHSPG